MCTRELATFLSQLRFEDLPPSVVEQAKTAVQDFVGISLFAAKNTPWGKLIGEFATDEGDGPATVIGFARKTIPCRAALANGTMALGFEYEDVYIATTGHPYAAVAPAALALAEKEKVGGKELLTAVVAGYETFARTGLASGRTVCASTILRGLYPQRLYGGFAAAAAAGSILKLDPEKMAIALGLVGEQAYGTMQSHAEGAWSRRWHGGRSAEDGVSAASLAKTGFIGPRQILDGQYNFYRVHGFECEREQLTEGLGERWAIEDVWFKAYPTCGGWHSTIDLVLDMKRDYSIKPEDVRQMTGYLREMSPLWKQKQYPTVIAAQFSTPFAMATAMLKGKVTVAEFTEQTIRDPEIIAFAEEKVEADFAKDLDKKGEDFVTLPSRVVIQMKDGREYTREELYPKGHAKNPMSPAELRAKFESLAATVLDKNKVQELYGLIRNLDQVDDVSQLTTLLRP